MFSMRDLVVNKNAMVLSQDMDQSLESEKDAKNCQFNKQRSLRTP